MSVFEQMDAILSKRKLKSMLNIEKNILKPRIRDWRVGHYGKDMVH